MNVSGMIRGYMSKNQSGEEYIRFVATSIEKQLKEWDSRYEVMLLQLKNYELVVLNGGHSYLVTLSKDEVEVLKNKGPFALDRIIWSELKNQGLPILSGFGNYLEILNIK